MKKRLLSLIVVISIILGSFIPAFNSFSYAEDSIDNEEFSPLPPDFEGRYIDKKNIIELHDENEEIRVIVELEAKSINDLLMSQGNASLSRLKEQNLSLKQEVEQGQESVMNKIKKVGIDLDIKERFNTLINGFSFDIYYKDISTLLAIPGVKDVHIVNTYTIPEYVPAQTQIGNPDLTGIERAWELGYRGEGQLVSIIDSGIDVNHKDMVITDLEKAKIKDGFKFNEKVPFGYNWTDNNSNIKDNPIFNGAHGMHVAGIVAGNGEYKGVAPEAQLIGQKVFPNHTRKYAQSDALIKAVEDSVVKGAEIVNLSLGSRSGFVNPNDPFHKVIQKAIDNGVSFAIAAGNDMISTNPLPIYSNNPDMGVLGAPGTVKDAITVGSFESSKINQYLLEFKTKDSSGKIAFVNSNNGVAPHIALEGQEYPLLHVGKGTHGDFPEDMTGKIAFIENHNYSFNTPATIAHERNAEAVIFYNSPGLDVLDIVLYDDEIDIPVVVISSEDGFRLMSIIHKGANISFNGEIRQIDSPDAGKVSEFSSWGPNPDLSFKPNVVAPGGNIWSTINDNQYDNMSGTSMSSPNVAGAVALINQYLEEKHPEIQGRDKTVEIKNRLMSTAKPVKPSEGDIEYSPRQQGAGLINVDKAITTKAILTSKNGLNGIELGSIGNQKSFNFNIKNQGDEALTFKIETSKVITDGRGELPAEFNTPDYQFPLDKEYNTLKPVEVEGATIVVEEEITVGPGESKIINGNINIPNTTHDNIFIDGYIYLNSQTEGQSNLVIPYIGFYGDWETLDIVDAQAGEDDSYYNFTSLATTFMDYVNLREVLLILGSYEDEDGNMRINNDNVAFAPQGWHSQNYRQLQPVASLMRNAQDFEINILDSNKEKLRSYVKERLIRKSGWTYNAPFYVTSDSWIWDGLLYNTANGFMEQAPEGQYYMQVRSKVEGSDKWQEKLLPVKVDNTGPEIKITSERPIPGQKGYKLTWEAEDALSGIEFYTVQSNAQVLASSLDNDINEFVLDAKDVGMHTLQVRAYDNAYNYTSSFLNYGEPDTSGEKEPIRQYAPGRLEVLKKNIQSFQARFSPPKDDTGKEGYWVNPSMKIVDSKGETIEFKEYDGNNQKHFYIQEHIKIVNDGKYEIIYEGTDSFGNHHEDRSYFWLDTTPPEISFKNLGESNTIAVDEDQETYILEGVISDNLTGLFLWINGEPVVEEYFDYIEIDPIEFSYEHKLKEGNNILQIQLSDSAGHRIYETVTIIKPISKEAEAINVSGEFVNEYYSGKYTNRIKTKWEEVTDAEGYNVYLDDMKVNEEIITSKNYIINENEDINLSRQDDEDKIVKVKIEALDSEGNVISEGLVDVTIPMNPYIEWIKLNGKDITDDYNITNLDNDIEVQVKFSHRLKDNYWNRSDIPTGHIEIKKQDGYKALPANFNYDEEKDIYTLNPWGGLISGEIYTLTVKNNLSDVFNGVYTEANITKLLNINDKVDESTFEVDSIKIDGRDFTDRGIERVPVDTKLVVTFNSLVDIETYEEDDHYDKYAGIWLTTEEDASKGYGPTRLIKTEYTTIEDEGKLKSVMTLQPKITSGYSYKTLNENTNYYVVVEGEMKNVFGKTIGNNKVFNFKTINSEEIPEKLDIPIITNLDSENFVNVNNVEIKGEVTTDAKINVYVNNVLYESLDSFEKKFETEIKLDEGENLLRFESEIGHIKSEKTGAIKIIVDTIAPVIDIMEPEDDSTTNDKVIRLKGKLDEENLDKLTINDEEVELLEDKTFTIDIELEEGENTITIVATDKAGNSTTEIVTITRVLLPEDIPTHMVNLPVNTVIFDGNAYDISYLENYADGQYDLIEWHNARKSIYVKLMDETLVDFKNKEVDLDVLPDELVYYSKDGETTIYRK